MAEIRPGSVVAIPFPYSNLKKAKLRPALVLAKIKYGDLVVCQITSKPYSNNEAIKLEATDIEEGGLPVVSYVRPDKLMTLHKSICLGVSAYISEEFLEAVIKESCKTLQGEASQK